MHAIAGEMMAFIERGEGDFGPLAARLFKHQFHANQAYETYCRSLRVSPDSLADWRDIPPVPAVSFKRQTLTCVPADECPVVFHSSGTTVGQPSRHFMDSDAVAVYNASLTRGFALAISGADSMPIWSLVPPPEEMPHSSLSHMVSALMRAPGDHRWFWRAQLDSAGLSASLHAARKPVVLFGTALAWMGFFDRWCGEARLPDGSLVIETGGMKGAARQISPYQLYQQFVERLGVPMERCIAEYGMCEMASQFYDDAQSSAQPESRSKHGPLWCRTRVTDPTTGHDVEVGQTGVLTHYDLANTNSVLAIRTEDIAVRMENGFRLLGRAPDSELRGCSLTAEKLLAD